MKKLIFPAAAVVLLLCGCVKSRETDRLDSYLQTFGYNIEDYRIVCFVPVDGCSSCIAPTLNFSQKTRSDFLLVLSSIYTKSVNHVLEIGEFEDVKLICDTRNDAEISGFVQTIAPSYYYLKNGRIIKKVDSSKTLDKASVLADVENFLNLQENRPREH